MKRRALPIHSNPLAERADVEMAVRQLCQPLLDYYSEGKARLKLGHTRPAYPDAVAELEGFSRVLWGLVPFTAGGGQFPEMWEAVLEGIRNGTNPAHPEYWGDAADYDQRLVEMAAIGFALALVPEQMWEPLKEQERERLYAWLNQINHRKLWDCNWLFFQVMVNVGFRRVGLPWDRELTRRYLKRIDAFYLSNGWYADGAGGHFDYYGPSDIHFFSLLYALLMEEEDRDRCVLYKERADAFAKEFIHWFAADGSALPYGRSLTYRFSQTAFWSALALHEEHAFPMGVLKGIVLRHLRWWFRQPIFHTDGTLTIGYAYPNLIMSENYNGPGSPYWGMKAFLPLALPPEHAFWQAEELPLPELPDTALHKEPRMKVHRQAKSDHVLLFNAGHSATTDHTHTSAKYEKFVYSNRFGFSVPRGEWGLAQGAFDSMLALSEGDNLFRVKRTSEEAAIQDHVIYTRWKPWHDVDIRTWLITGAPWHVRIHCIRSKRALEAADGGFALGMDNGSAGDGGTGSDARGDGRALAVSSRGASGILALYGGGSAELVIPQANTNLLHSRTVIPTVIVSLSPGESWLVTGVYGQPGSEDAMLEWNHPPRVKVTADEVIVYMGTSPLERFAVTKRQPGKSAASPAPSV